MNRKKVDRAGEDVVAGRVRLLALA
jgi:hypothetical protein